MRNKYLRSLSLVVMTTVLLTSQSTSAWALFGEHPNQIVKRTGFNQNIGAQLPLDFTFQDERGKTVRFGSYFGDKPVVLIFAYYECPMLCTLVLNGLLRSIKAVPWTVGNEYDVVVVGIDPDETPDLALAKKTQYVKHYDRAGSEGGWHFLTGSEEAIKPLADAAGFEYQYDAERDEYSHPSGVIVVTPEGQVSRYFFGIEYSSRDMKLAIMDSSKHRLGSFTDQLLLLCYHYDPAMGKYTLPILTIMRIFGLLTVMVMVGFIVLMLRREKRHIARLELERGGNS